MATILDTGEGLYPERKPHPKIYNRFEDLSETQRAGVDLMLEALKKDEQAKLLLCDGTGVGKTLQILATAWAIAKRENRPCLVVTKADRLLTVMQAEARKQKIGPHRVIFCDYEQLENTLAFKKFPAILFDEAHMLEDHPALEELHRRADKCAMVLASATAFSSPGVATCLLALAKGKSENEVLEQLDLNRCGDEYTPIESWGETTARLLAAKEKLMRKGKCLQRFLVFEGKATWKKAPSHERESSITEMAAKEIQAGRKVILYSKNPSIREAVSHLQPVHVEDFQKNRGNLIYLNPEENAEGIRLHDRSGDNPRTIIIDGPASAEDLIQIQGRSHRRKAKSDTKLIGVYDPHTDKDALANLAATTAFLQRQREIHPALGLAALEIQMQPEPEMAMR